MNDVRRGFTLVEATISTVVVAVVVTAALSTLGSSQQAQRTANDRSRGQLLAEHLMTEIMQQAYDGTCGGGSATSRTLYNYVDCYANMIESPPRTRDGTAFSEFTGWTRKVMINWVSAADTNTTSSTDSGLKRITVQVYCGSRLVASLTGLRTRGWDQHQPM